MPDGILGCISPIFPTPFYFGGHMRGVENDASALANYFRVDSLQGICGAFVHPDDGGAYGSALAVNTYATVELSADCET